MKFNIDKYLGEYMLFTRINIRTGRLLTFKEWINDKFLNCSIEKAIDILKHCSDEVLD